MPAIAKSLGVPSGPAYSLLSRGKSVKADNGKIVTPEMVLGPQKPGGGVVIAELPTRDHISAFLDRPELQDEEIMLGVEGFIWILGPGVIGSEIIIQYIDDHPQFKHIVSSAEACPNRLIMGAAAACSVKHHILDSSRFPVLKYNNDPPAQALSLLKENPKESRFSIADPGLRLRLEPSVAIETEDIIPPPNLVQSTEQISQEVHKLATEARNDIASKSHQEYLATQDLPSSDAEVIFLGTGSAAPSAFRNVAGILLRVPGHGTYMFDAGENSMGQLRRMYDPPEMAEILRDLKFIFISHMHADHHLGTCALIKAWYEEVHGDQSSRPRGTTPETQPDNDAFRINQLTEHKKLFIIGPDRMTQWLEEYSSVEDFGYDQLIAMNSKSVDSSHLDDCSLYWKKMDVGFNTCRSDAM